jgi:hypothetical protein
MGRGRNKHYQDKTDSYSIEPITGCWIWTGYVRDNGYGNCSQNYKNRLAHVVVWEKHKGPVPAGLELDHLCRNRRCVNPAHLEAVTHATNARRGARSILDEWRAAKIKELLPFESDGNLATLFGVSRRAIYSIRNGITWTGVN